MKRLIVMILVCSAAAWAMAGTTAGSASAAAWHCLATWWGLYKEDGAIGQQCKNHEPWFFHWSLFETNTAKVIATGVLCALVEAGEPSLYNGSNCGASEEHKGTGEWSRALDIEERFYATAQEKLLSEKVQTQVFTTENGTVECTEAKIEGGESSASAVATQLAFIEYGKCTAFTFINAKITLADFLFKANGTVDQDNLVHISVSGSNCLTSVPAQNGLSSVKYDNVGKNIKLLPNVSGIVYTGSSGCAHSGLFSNGTYTGNSEVMIAKGQLGFLP